MYLKSIEIQGFKSFANKIRLEFHNGITGIVGPNGSGKSNVADAVRWVLGEQRARQLRGGSMQDVIFSGTQLRKPLGYAYVAITLDNADHVLPIEYDEVTVSRRLYRSGESEYMINGNACRLKDVNEIFYDTGIGKEGYSIIGRGQIDQILSSKPEDRRSLFDEAAGIVKFKLRKDTALRKLEDGKSNLTRISDILSELEKQTGPLEKQAEVAKIFLKNREELKRLDINVFLLENASRRAELTAAETDAETASAQLAQTRERHTESARRYDELQEQLEQLDAAIEEARIRITDTSVKREKLEGQIGILSEQIRSAKNDAAHFETRKADQARRIADREAEQARLLSEKEGVDTERLGLEKQLAEARAALKLVTDEEAGLGTQLEDCRSRMIEQLNEQAAIRARLSALETKAEQAQIRKSELTGKLVRARSDESRQEETLTGLREQFDRITEEIRGLNREQKDAEQELAGMKDRLSACDVRLRAANAARQNAQSRLEALANLTERYEGYGGAVKRVMEQKGREPGIIGVVADIIKTGKKYETAIEVALGGSIQNIVTEDEETAKRMIRFLKETKSGRATFLPLTSMERPRELANEECLREKGVIGTADTLVETDPRYLNVARSLLSRIVVAETADDALRIERKYHHSLRMVTLEGELLTPGGAISGGAFRNTSNLLGRRREMEELEEQVRELTQAEAEAQRGIEETKERRNELRQRMETCRTTLQDKFIEQNTARLNVQAEEDRQREQQGALTDLRRENEEIETQIRDVEKERTEQQERLAAAGVREQELKGQAEQLTAALDALRGQEESRNAAVSEAQIAAERVIQQSRFQQEGIDRVAAELAEDRAAYEEIIASMEQNAKALEERERDLEIVRGTIETSRVVQSDADRALSEKRAEKEALAEDQKEAYRLTQELSETLSGLEREMSHLTARCERCREAIEAKINYMWDEYEITLSDAAAMRDESMTDLPSMKKEIASLKDQIRKLGDVNVNAIEDYKNLMERYTFLKGQHDDLVQAEETLRGIIAELDNAMRKQFDENFAKIKQEFDTVFKELFGGGKGTVELMEDEDILEAGIRIIAQP
ncbi:MAG: chromosome segregation protein SMC, partial [Butyrivibrio sp.]|nr:chromosome segregation protein SMC [Butyrivibrio sp.]